MKTLRIPSGLWFGLARGALFIQKVRLATSSNLLQRMEALHLYVIPQPLLVIGSEGERPPRSSTKARAKRELLGSNKFQERRGSSLG
jgi:hypothetical protein